MLDMRAFCLGLASLTLVACQTPPAVDVQPEFTTAVELSRVNPRDVAVLPVEDASPGQAAAPLLDQIRSDLEKNLVLRRYSPLNPRFVNASFSGSGAAAGASRTSVLEPGYLGRVAGSFDAETGVLAVRLNRWDESSLLSRARVGFQVEAVLVAGGTGVVLWSGRLEGSIKAGGDGPAPVDPGERRKSAATMVVEQLLLNLPTRHL